MVDGDFCLSWDNNQDELWDANAVLYRSYKENEGNKQVSEPLGTLEILGCTLNSVKGLKVAAQPGLESQFYNSWATASSGLHCFPVWRWQAPDVFSCYHMSIPKSFLHLTLGCTSIPLTLQADRNARQLWGWFIGPGRWFSKKKPLHLIGLWYISPVVIYLSRTSQRIRSPTSVKPLLPIPPSSASFWPENVLPLHPLSLFFLWFAISFAKYTKMPWTQWSTVPKCAWLPLVRNIMHKSLCWQLPSIYIHNPSGIEVQVLPQWCFFPSGHTMRVEPSLHPHTPTQNAST